MRVLVACEYSGRVRDAFRSLGHDAMSCDLIPTDVPGPHYQGDIRDVLEDGWDVLIAHPPCTYLTNSGVRWLYTDERDAAGNRMRNEARWDALREAADFFRLLLNAPIPHRMIENPVMHGHGRALVGRGPDQIIQPWMFGHAEQKATGLWLANLPPLIATKNVRAYMMTLPERERQRLHWLGPGPDRWKERSATFPGIADAIAHQVTAALP